MAFDWSLYLSLAEELAKRTSEEQCQRSSISRAYYAAFKKAENWLVEHDKELPLATTGIHMRVWGTFRQYGRTQPAKRVGSRGDMLRQFRIKADYHDNYKGDTRREAAAALKLSEEVLKLLAGLGKSEVV